eukprot:TRINITY_DN48102_c0_g1_i1.p1 TRINITY_DN48102_c0_g1~~TRINITY_DN48102_c0_g1_i1.p1  ORF type:complete len:332 (+),score=47.60 TRINITY_DN48102_c0_g1_i1:110-997(+)
MANVESLRLLRILRLARVARIIRVIRFFSELRVMVQGILGSARSLLWALVLLLLIIYLYAVTLLQLLSSTADANEAQTETKTHYGYRSLYATMVTLFMAISGGVDWQNCVQPLDDVHWLLGLSFMAYVFFTMFCCLNIITGIFVENASELRRLDEAEVLQAAKSERKRWVSEVVGLFGAFCSDDGSGEMTFDKFEQAFNNDMRTRTLLEKLGIHVDCTSAEELWELFDMDSSGQVDEEEFARGIKQFHGFARSIDLHRLHKEAKSLKKQLVKSGALPGAALHTKAMKSMNLECIS